MKEILELKQQILLGNFNESYDLVTEIETMARQSKIDTIENTLTFAVSCLMLIQIQDRIHKSTIYEIRNSLLKIQQYNRLDNSYFLESERDWETIFDRCIPLALLLAVEKEEIGDFIDVEELKRKVDFKCLQIETLSLLRLMYSLNAYEIDRYLGLYWKERQIVSP